MLLLPWTGHPNVLVALSLTVEILLLPCECTIGFRLIYNALFFSRSTTFNNLQIEKHKWCYKFVQIMSTNYPVKKVYDVGTYQPAGTGFAPLHVIEDELGSSDSSV
jgi:hypothetical protein